MSAIQQDLSPALQWPELQSAYDRRLPAAQSAMQNWAKGSDPHYVAFRNSLNRTDDFGLIEQIVEHLTKDATDVIVLGIGGSSLGAQALAQLRFWGTAAYAPEVGKPRLHIVDNLDPDTFGQLLSRLDLKTTRFHAVSKSGSTTEPLVQLLTAIDAMERAGGGKYLKFHFSGEAEPGANPLRTILNALGAPVLDHDPALGGRYTAFSSVGLVPSLIAGIDIRAFRNAGAAALASAENGDSGAIAGAALATAARDVGLSQQVLWSYTDRLERLAKWWRQLWAESLGKQGFGTTPIDALGPVDQHSQLQLYLDGPRDKLFTLVGIQGARGPAASRDWSTRHSLPLYAGRRLSTVVSAQYRATSATLLRHARPHRIINLPAPLSEASLAQLMVHFILETLITAKLWGIDPFGQPAVEEGKVLTRQFLEQEA